MPPMISKKGLHLWLLLFCLVLQVWVNLSSWKSVMVTFSVISELSVPEVVFLFDWVSWTFLSMLTIVGSLVFWYSYEYMNSVKAASKFYSTLFLFCLSMGVLSVSGDVFWMMVGWDGLGITSFCLVMFFQNWKALSGALVTFLTNRLGDLFLLCSIVWLLLEEKTVFSGLSCNGYVVLALVIGGVTKSAQIPFSAWLPMAMAAPTPVSSLVHSSTLVTAGVYISARFLEILSQTSLQVLYALSSVTVLAAGSSALYEWDLKKVIAFSTLTHIGLMLNLLSLGEKTSALMHMYMHSFFKSLMFMSAGIMIHQNALWQDIRRMSWMASSPEWAGMAISLLSMAGIPFLAGFCSKELMMMSVLGTNKLLGTLPFWCGVCLTMGYSVRMLLYLVSSWGNSMKESSVFCKKELVLGSGLSVSAGFLMWQDVHFKLVSFVYFEPLAKGVLLTSILLGVALGGLAVESKVAFSLPKVAWKNSAFAYFMVDFVNIGSWYYLNVLDVKGILGRMILSTSSSVVTACGNFTKKVVYFFPLLKACLGGLAVTFVLSALEL